MFYRIVLVTLLALLLTLLLLVGLSLGRNRDSANGGDAQPIKEDNFRLMVQAG